MRPIVRRRATQIGTALFLAGALALATAATVLAHGQNHRRLGSRTTSMKLHARVFASGAKITHPITGGTEAISDPDDITFLGGHIFVAFQNGVGPQGQASTSGNLDSTVVEFSRSGHRLAQWDVVGKCDGLTADPIAKTVIATVNEDANSSLYLIAPRGGSKPVHYSYSEALPSDGGTDAIEIYHGEILISASAPGTTGTAAPQASYPAVYKVALDHATHTAKVKELFGDEATAIVANTNSSSFGKKTTLALTDPDSNEVVPSYAHRFAGDFMLTSQGDEEQIYYSGAHKPLHLLKLTASVDDSAWPSGRGTIYTTDNSSNKIIAVSGSFVRGAEMAAVTPCDENSAPSTCPAAGYPANYLGQINPRTGVITRVHVDGPAFEPQGMLFVRK